MNTYNKINESEYSNKVIGHIKNDPLEKRIDLKKIYSISNDEYVDILEYETNLIDSLRGEIFDTSDPKWSGTGNYEFEFEIDYVDTDYKNEKEYVLFKGDVIDIHVDIDVHGTVFIGSTMIDNPGREWTISEATNDKNIGYIVISEIRDIVYTIIEQRLPILKNLGTLNVCDVKEGWVTRLSNEDKGNINEGVYNTGDNKDFLEYVYNDLVENTKFRDASYRDIDIYDGKCYSLQIGIRWGSQSPYFNFVPECLDKLLRDIYGLNYKEINELFWGRYDEHIISMVLSKKENLAPHLRRLGLGYLNESVDNKFLDKVVNNLIRETKPTSEKHVSVITPFNSLHNRDGYWVLTAHRCREVAITHPENYMIPEIITKHLKSIYSLQSIEEMEYVMGKYYFNLYNKYFRKFFDNTVRGKISESEDLEYNKSYWEKENQFFVKIVNQIMRETVIDYKNNKIKFPIIKFPFDEIMEISPLDIKNINIIFDSNISNISGDFANNFYRHCRDVYGLKYNEIKRLWPLYSVELVKHILKVYNKWEDYHRSGQGTMGTLLPESTKSVGDNSEFLNKMIDYLVDTTELVEVPHHPNIRVKYPFVDYSSNNKIPHMWYESIPKVIFIVGIMENYGVNGEEAHFVLDKYREKLRDKVHTKLPNG